MINLNLFRKTYTILKHNLILIQPLLIFSFLFIFMINIIAHADSASPALAILILSICALFCVFMSGWLNMFHKCIANSNREGVSDEEKALSSLNLLQEFFPGVGKYFFDIVIGMLIYILILAIMMLIGYFLIGLPSVATCKTFISGIEHQSQILSNINQVNNLLNHISRHDQIKVSIWFYYIFSVSSFLSLLTMFWKQAIISLEKKPLLAYFESLITVFKNPIYCIMIFLSYKICSFFINITGSLFTNFIFSLLILVLFFLTEVYFTMMTFLYFEEYRKNNNHSWTDSFR